MLDYSSLPSTECIRVHCRVQSTYKMLDYSSLPSAIMFIVGYI